MNANYEYAHLERILSVIVLLETSLVKDNRQDVVSAFQVSGVERPSDVRHIDAPARRVLVSTLARA